MLVLLPLTPLTLYIFACGIGLLWLGTVVVALLTAGVLSYLKPGMLLEFANVVLCF